MRFIAFLSAFFALIPVSQAETISANDTVDAIIQSINDHDAKRLSLNLGELAKREPGISAQYSVLLEGLKVYYDLHASEVKLRALYEMHTHAYLRWMHARDHLELGKETPIAVAEKLGRAEASRLDFFRERTNNILLRDRFVEMTGLSLPEELIDPPRPPANKPPNMDSDALLTAAGMAKASVKDRRRVFAETLHIGDAWQRIIAAKATYEGANAVLLHSQQMYANARSTSIGAAMAAVTRAEAELIKATGEYAVRTYRLAILLKQEYDDPLELTRNGMAEDYLYKLTNQDINGAEGGYVPRSGTGYGQNEDDSLLPQ